MKVLCKVGQDVVYAVPGDMYTYGLGAVVSGLMRVADVPKDWDLDTEGIEIAQEIGFAEKVSAVLKSLLADYQADVSAAANEFSNIGTMGASDVLQDRLGALTHALNTGDIKALDDMYLKAIT